VVAQFEVSCLHGNRYGEIGRVVSAEPGSEIDMFRIVLACGGVPTGEGAQAALDIAKEFNDVRTPRYTNSTCIFEHGSLVLSCDTDWDSDGLNLMDEFSDCLSACIATPFDGDLRLVAVTVL
jgi:hypothetical protein